MCDLLNQSYYYDRKISIGKIALQYFHLILQTTTEIKSYLKDPLKFGLRGFCSCFASFSASNYSPVLLTKISSIISSSETTLMQDTFFCIQKISNLNEKEFGDTSCVNNSSQETLILLLVSSIFPYT